MVTIFCGQALPLDKEIMARGGDEEKKEHLLETLGLFLQDRIEHLFQPQEGSPLPEAAANVGGANARPQEREESAPEEAPGKPAFVQPHHRTVISEDELDTFRNIELKLIDNKEYFRAVFQ